MNNLPRDSLFIDTNHSQLSGFYFPCFDTDSLWSRCRSGIYLHAHHSLANDFHGRSFWNIRLIRDSSNTSALIYSQDNAKNLLFKCLQQSPSWSKPFTNYFISPRLIFNGGRKIFLWLTRGQFKTFFSPNLNSILSGLFFRIQLILFARLSQRHKNKDTCYKPRSRPLIFKSPTYRQVVLLIQHLSRTILMQFSFSFKECPINIEAKTSPLCNETHRRLLSVLFNASRLLEVYSCLMSAMRTFP